MTIKKLYKRAYWIIVLVRPRQWIKNFALFVAIFLSGKLFETESLMPVVWGFVVFCFLSSSSYIVNDILDAPYDRRHPYKKDRPIARGAVTEGTAFLIALALAVIGLTGAVMINIIFFLISFLYLILRYSNSVVLRHIVIIDILTLALGYLLRVYAGVAASGYYISIWLLLAVLSLSLLISVGKRRADLTLLGKEPGSDHTDDDLGAIFHGKYSERMVNTYTAMFATATFITYAYYTFLVNFEIQGFFVPSITVVDLYFFQRKWMMMTIPFVLYGIMRFLQIIYEEKRDTLEKIITGDIPLAITGIMWFITAFLVIYGIGG